MNKKFCPKCSGATLYEDEMPRVCSRCAHQFASSLAAQILPSFEEEPQPQRKVRPIQQENRPQAARLKSRNKIEAEIQEDYDEDYEENTGQFDVPDIEIDETKISGWKRQKITGKDLAFDQSPKENIQRPGLKKMSKNQLQKHISDEIGSNGKDRKDKSTEIGGF